MTYLGDALGVLHVFAVVLAAGGAFFQLIALHPTLARLEPDVRRSIREAVVARWRIVVLVSILVLLVTGFANYLLFKVPEYRGHPHKGLYHGLIGVKILAAFVAFHAATVLVLPGTKGERYRDQAGFWLTLLAVTMVVVIAIGAFLNRFRVT